MKSEDTEALLCFYADICRVSLERARQATVGTILVASHASVAVYFG